MKGKYMEYNNYELWRQKKYEKEIEKAINIFNKYGEIRYISRISFMLSNLCNYAFCHRKCPTSRVKANEKEILSTEYIVKTLMELKNFNFFEEGVIAFHIYNEPTMDPRLFMLIEKAKEILPKANIFIYTNGYYLNEDMMREYENIGIAAMSVTAYNNSEYDRLSQLKTSIPYNVLRGLLDNRMDNYNLESPIKESKLICRSFLSEVCIYSDGKLGLCCLDYLHPYGLGNIKERSLIDILKSKKVTNFTKELLSNNRTAAICKRCGWAR